MSDIEAARADLRGRGVEISEAFHGDSGVYDGPDEPYLFGRRRSQWRAAAAHGQHEARIAQTDKNSPDRYAEYMMHEQKGKELPR